MDAPTGPVRAVLVDADGVLQTNPDGWLEEVRGFVAAEDGKDFTDHLFGAEERAMTGSVSFADVVAEVTAHWGIGDRAEELVGHWRRIEVCADTVAVLRELRAAGVGCHLVTNQNDLRAAYMRAELGYADLLDSTFVSCELGVLKDDPRFFEQVLAVLGLPATEVLLVDDKDRFVDVARSVGLRGVVWTVDDGAPALRAALRRHGLPV